MSHRHSRIRLAVLVGAVAASTTPAFAQLDPLFFMRGQAATSSTPNMAPNVIFVVDTSNRMQRDAATDPTNATTARDTSNYYDPFTYSPKTGLLYETQSLGINDSNTNTSYRRRFENLSLYNPGNADKGQTTHITAVGDKVTGATGFSMFEAPTRLSIARAAMYQAVSENKNVVRFGLIKMRQSSPALPTDAQTGTAVNTDAVNQTVSDAAATKWKIHRPIVGANNGSLTNVVAPMVSPTSGTANTDVLTILAKAPSSAGALIPAGNDTSTDFDTPVKFMLDDAWDAAKQLLPGNNDPACRNTVVVLIVGGGEGTTATGVSNNDLATRAAAFVNLNNKGYRVPIHVIALAPPASDSPFLQAIATSSGGVYTEISKTQIDIALGSIVQQQTAGVTAPAGTVIVPDVVNAINYAVQQTFAASTDFNANATASPVIPKGNPTEYQVTSPIIGTVNLNNAKSIITGINLYDGSTFKQPPDVKDKQGTVIPQRNNVMVTTGVEMPGFDGRLRSFLVYKPHTDSSQPTGYKFKSDGTRIWVACVPGQTGCAVADSNLRNLYTADASGNMIPFTTANTATLAPLMNLTSAIDASNVIAKVRQLGFGAVIDSTPAFLNPPSLDPPPDDAYPGFAVKNKDRRTLIWAGTNRGILEAIDARTGVEVWGFIPLNLLPKLRTLLDGQPVGKFDFFMDGSPKLSDVRLTGICDPVDHPSDCWRTHIIVGEGPGGTFYQSFDVTMDNLGTCIAPDNDNLTTLLGCFNSVNTIKLNWAFPSYSHFDVCAPLAAVDCTPIKTYGDVSASATDVEKTVGQTWSDPAVGQIYSTSGPFSVLLGSGFLPYSTQQQSNRGGKVAGTTFYILDAKTGTVHHFMDVGSDGLNEVNAAGTTSADDCTTAAAGCKNLKNALQTDPVATGPSDSRFINRAYLGDLDGNIWRFDIDLSLGPPTISKKNLLYSAGSNQPIFSSMATVSVPPNQYVFFGSGSDLLPAVSDNNTKYNLYAVKDTGAATGSTQFTPIALTKANNLSTDERVTAFPAVAGDIVFFTTTTYKTSSLCSAPDAKLYALTFTGGPAYDTNNDGTLTSTDNKAVTTIAGQRATAPFIVDQHLVFGTQGKISVFGDPEDFNNGVGQAGVRILSWREVR
jgi:hypothetical protein